MRYIRLVRYETEQNMTAKMTVDVKVIDTLRAERDALRREVLKYQQDAHDANVTLIHAIQLLREVQNDYNRAAKVSVIHLEEIYKFLRMESQP